MQPESPTAGAPPGGKPTLFDLPCKVRKAIFNMAIDEHPNVIIPMHRYENNRLVTSEQFDEPCLHPDQQWAPDRQKWTNSQNTLSLLRVNRQIRREGTPIAYRRCCFRPRDLATLDLMFAVIGSPLCYIRSLDLSRMPERFWFIPFKEGAGLADLEKLTLPKYIWYPVFIGDSLMDSRSQRELLAEQGQLLADCLGPLLRTLSTPNVCIDLDGLFDTERNVSDIEPTYAFTTKRTSMCRFTREAFQRGIDRRCGVGRFAFNEAVSKKLYSPVASYTSLSACSSPYIWDSDEE